MVERSIKYIVVSGVAIRKHLIWLSIYYIFIYTQHMCVYEMIVYKQAYNNSYFIYECVDMNFIVIWKLYDLYVQYIHKHSYTLIRNYIYIYIS